MQTLIAMKTSARTIAAAVREDARAAREDLADVARDASRSIADTIRAGYCVAHAARGALAVLRGDKGPAIVHLGIALITLPPAWRRSFTRGW